MPNKFSRAAHPWSNRLQTHRFECAHESPDDALHLYVLRHAGHAGYQRAVSPHHELYLTPACDASYKCSISSGSVRIYLSPDFSRLTGHRVANFRINQLIQAADLVRGCEQHLGWDDVHLHVVKHQVCVLAQLVIAGKEYKSV